MLRSSLDEKYVDSLLETFSNVEIRQRFWFKVDILQELDCWEWKAGKHISGYGKFWMMGKTFLAHRMSWKLTKEEPWDDYYVCHRCDFTSCVNPNHLFLATTQENTKDKVAKGRQSKGERSGNAKLSELQVLQIKKKLSYGEIQQNIATEFGVSKSLIGAIKQNLVWKFLEENNG